MHAKRAQQENHDETFVAVAQREQLKQDVAAFSLLSL